VSCVPPGHGAHHPGGHRSGGGRAGNVCYCFKTKDDIIAAVMLAHVDQLEAAFVTLERGDRSPKARLKALVGVVAKLEGSIAQFGCPYGTLCSELAKRVDGLKPLAAYSCRVVSAVSVHGMKRRVRLGGGVCCGLFEKWTDAFTT
jgi:hypothetical protein